MKLIAACAFGLEALVKWELKNLGYEPRVEQPGRVSFEGHWADVCRTNIWLRIADRVLIEITQFDSPDFDALFDTVKAIDWSELLPGDANFPCHARTRHSQLTSVPALQRTLKKAVVESLLASNGGAELPETGATYRIEAALLHDVATITLDTSGASLHKRGYRKLVGPAPLKETLAAALVQLSVWNAGRPLIDPFCGSGTIPIEAALYGLNIAPGIGREFACSDWHTISTSDWQTARDEALDSQKRDLKLNIIGTDRDAEVLSLARYHAERAGVADQIHFQQKAFSDLRSKQQYGCVICNPPYGKRLEDQSHLDPLYQSIPATLQRLPTWSHFILTSMPHFERIIQKKATRRRKLFNGRIECTYYQYLGPKPDSTKLDPNQDSDNDVAQLAVQTDLAPNDETVSPSLDPKLEQAVQTHTASDSISTNDARRQIEDITSVQTDDVEENQIAPVASTPQTEPPELDSNSKAQSEDTQSTRPVSTHTTAPVFGGLQPKDHEQAQLFASRLKKRARHLRRWPSRGITCFRIYERDIPELPLVVDRYDQQLHITEYERPHERDLARHAAWLELMKKTASATLEIPIHRVHLKSRVRQRDQRQYVKVDAQKRRITVVEDGLNFLVNLTDYVDTGLFLDHRKTRQMVRSESSGCRFLNLFAYTGSFSVYAAAGGATSTMTVDWSKNYTGWANDNMVANDFTGPEHQFVAQDAMTFLQKCGNQKFDLAVVDPPTFSNSKRSDSDWDVQHDHADLLNLLYERLAPEATVYFSNNFRRFKLDENALSRYEIIEISRQTVPEDFRNKRIHRCWKLVKTKS